MPDSHREIAALVGLFFYVGSRMDGLGSGFAAVNARLDRLSDRVDVLSTRLGEHVGHAS